MKRPLAPLVFALVPLLWSAARAASPAGNPAVWLRGDAGVSLDSSGNVQQWDDQSGNGYHFTQGDAARRPTPLLNALVTGAGDLHRLPANQTGTNVYAGTLAMDFIAEETITITHLAAFDHNRDGFTGQITVRLWERNDGTTSATPGDDTEGTIRATVIFNNSEPGELRGCFRWKELETPLVLAPGAYTVGGTGYNSPDLYYSSPNRAGRPLQGGLRWVGTGRYSNSTGWPEVPGNSQPDSYAGAVNFSYERSTVAKVNHRGIRFDGVNDGLIAPTGLNVGRPHAVFVVYDRDGSNAGYLIQNNSSPHWHIGSSGFWGGSGWVSDVDIPWHTPQVATMTGNSAGSRAFSGYAEVTKNFGLTSSNPGRIALGGGAGYSNYPLAARITEVLVYDRELTPGEVRETQTYLAAKYGLFATSAAAPEIAPSGSPGTGPVSVTLTTSTVGGQIRYTTNGTDPVVDSTLYSGAFSVPRGTEVRARTFLDGAVTSGVSAQFYEDSAASELPVAGAKMWLRGDRAVEKDEQGKVRRWRDLTGNGNDVIQELQAKRPTPVRAFEQGGGEAIRPMNPLGGSLTNHVGTLGMDFVVTEEIRVSELAAYDSNGDGFTNEIRVQIWSRDDKGTHSIPSDDTGGSMVSEASFTPGDPGDLGKGNSRWKSVAPVTLAPGPYSIIVWGYTGSNQYQNSGDGSWLEDGIKFVQQSRSSSSNGAWPNALDSHPVKYNSAANFRFIKTGATATTRDAVEFDGNDDGLLAVHTSFIPRAAAGDESTIYVVFDRRGAGPIIQSNANPWWMIRDDGGLSTNWVRYKSLPAGRPVVAAMANGLVNTRFFINGENWTNDMTPGVGVPGRLALGGGEGVSYAPSRNTIAEVIVFDHELSADERWRVENYLGARYQWNQKPLPEVTVSPAANYGTGSVSVSLTLDIPGTVIRYTTDGSDPTSASTTYSGPFSVERGTEVRARGFLGGGQGQVSKAYYGLAGGASDLPVAGAHMWLRADAGVELDENGAVRRWRDISGQGNDLVQSVQDSRPALSATGVAHTSLNAIVAADADGNYNHAGSLGEDFTVTEEVIVTHLGVFDHLKDNFEGDVNVQLWTRDDKGTPMIPGDDTGISKVAELTFTRAQPGELDGNSRFKPLGAPLTLAPGQYTIYASGYVGGNRYYVGNRSSGSRDGRFQFTRSRYGNSLGVWPNLISGSIPLEYNGAANFRVAASADAPPIVPSVVFDGIDDGLWGREGMNLTRPSTLFVVFQIERDDYGYIVNNGSSQWSLQRAGYYSNGWVRNENFDFRKGYVATMASSATGTRAYRNGNDVTVNGGLTVGNPGRLVFGGGVGPTVDPLHMRIAEIVAFDRVLTDTERFDIESYLANRHQIFDPEAEAPSISPATGYGTGNVSVTLTSPTPGAVIRYTLNGTEPTADSPIYNGALDVPRGTTVKAKAFVTGSRSSGVAEAFYGDVAEHPLPVTDTAMWLRADAGLVKDADGAVLRWRDLSGNGRDMTQNASERRPQAVEDAFSGAIKRVVFVPPGVSAGTEYTGWIGTDFVVDEAVDITHLGVFDHLSDGLARDITVRVHRVDDMGTPAPADDVSAEILVTQVFTPSNQGTLDGSVRYLELGSPLELEPGRYFIESSGWTGGNTYQGSDTWQKSVGEGISYLNVGRYRIGTSAFGGTIGQDNRYLSASGFKFRKRGASASAYRAVRFDGANDGMMAPEDYAVGRPSTIFMVYSQLGNAQGRLLQGATTNWLLGPHSGTQGYYADGWISQTPVQPGARSISIAVQDTNDSRYIYNGVDATTNSNYYGNLGRPAIGGGAGANNQPTNADLVELIIYDRVLSASERQQVSNTLSERYDLGVEPLVPPVASPNGGFFATAQMVALSHPVAGVEIRYTTNNEEPTASSNLYSAPFQVTANTTVKARAYLAGNRTSAVRESVFIIDAGAPLVPQRQAMLLWLRAGVGTVADTDGVSLWRDLSGKGSDARQDTVASRPILNPTAVGGAPGVVFDGSNDFLRLPEGFRNFSQGLTATFVFRAGAADNWQRLLDLGRGQNHHNVFFGRFQNSSSFSYDVRGTTQKNLAAADGMLPSANTVVTVTQQPTGAVRIFVNGSLISEDASFPLPLDVIRTSNLIGRSNWSVDAHYSGAISEIILYGTALTDLERESLENSVRARYGIATSATGIVTFSPSPEQLYPSGVAVTLSSLTEGARIHYTLDGTEPTESSALFSAPVNLTASTRVRARAFADGLNASPFSEATYLVGQPPSSGDGLTGTYYDKIDLTGATLVRVDPTVNFNWNGSAPDPAIPGTNFSVRWTGKVMPRFTENYVFYTASDDGQRLWVDVNKDGEFSPEELLINDWVSHGETERTAAPVALVAGQLYDIKMEYYQLTGPSSARLRWSSFSEPKAIIPQSQLFSDAEFAQTVTTPVISPVGGIHTAAVEVTITCATPAVTIYYTTDGSVPDTNSQVYGGAFTVGVTSQVRAKAYKTGFNPSGVATVSYQIDAQPPQISVLAWNGAPISDGESFIRKGELSAIAVDNDGVARAEFYYRPASSGNRVLIGEDTLPGNGLSVPWNIATITDGSYEVIVRVFDTSGTWSELTRTINVALVPLAAPVIASPVSGISVQESVVSLRVETEPDANVRILRDGAFIFSGYASSSGVMNYVAALPTGTSSFKAVARNRAGDSADSNAVSVIRVREFPQLAITFPAETIMENEQLTGTVSIPAAITTSVTVQVSVSKPGRFESMLPVVIPAGSTSATFQLSPRQNTIIELPAPVLITVAAVEHRSATVELMLADDDYPDITLALSETSVSETFGTVIGTATRAAATDRSLRIELSSSLPSRVGVPSHVNIPAGATSATFSVNILDDTLDNGNETAVISGRVLVGTTPVATAPAVNLEVRDDEGPVLILEMGRPLISEGGQVSATVRRSGGNSSPALAVALSSNPAGKLNLPSSVVIPANQNSAAFTITAPVDPVENGTRQISVRASAADYTDAITPLSLTDVQLPDLAVSGITAPSSVPTEQYMAVNYQVNNYGFAATTANFLERIYLSKDLSLSNDDLLVRQVDQTGEVSAGGSYTRSVTVLTPRDTGTYYLIVVVDPPNDVPEVDETNNTTVFVQPIQVRAAYDVTVQTAPEVVPANTPLVFTGSASREGGAPAQFSMVNIHIRVNNTSRIISAVTNSLGQFSVTWTPLRNEGGLYTIGAAHPGNPTAPVQDMFEILTLGLDSPPSVALYEGTSSTVNAILRNPNSRPLTGVSMTVPVAPPAGLTITPAVPATTVAAGDALVVPITVSAATGFSGNGSFPFLVQTNEGVVMEGTIGVRVELQKPVLTLDPQSLAFSVLRGGSKSASFTITNTGGLETGAIQVLLPDLPWLSVASANPVPSIPPGGNASVSLVLTPDATVPLTQYSGSLALNAANGGSKSFPYQFRVVSDLRGDLGISVVDELTFFTAEAPKLQGAQVTVRDAVTAQQIAVLETGADGLANFTNLPEGWYRVDVTAAEHDSFSGNYYVTAGQPNAHEIFISKQLVKYSWKVEEVDIEDVYQVKIETTFETNVPAPVVTVSPSDFDVGDLLMLGQSKTINMTIENHGFIAAQHGEINFSSHPFYEFKPLVTNIGTIPAKSSMVVPVIITRVGEFDEDGGIITISGNGNRVTKASASVPCGASGSVKYEFPCGQHLVQKIAVFVISRVSGNCSGGPGGGGGYIGWLGGYYWGGGGPGGGGGGGASGSSLNFASPDPCLNDCILKATLDCLIGYTPFGCVYSLVGCGSGLYDDLSGPDGVASGDTTAGCILAIQGCAADALGPVVGAINNTLQCGLAYAVCYKKFGGSGGAGSGTGPEPGPIQGSNSRVARNGNEGYFMTQEMRDLSPEMSVAWDRAETLLKWVELLMGGREIVLAMYQPGGQEFFSQFSQFMEADSDGGSVINESESAVLIALAEARDMDVPAAEKAIARWNRTLDYNSRGILRVADVPNGESTDFVDAMDYDNVSTAVVTAVTASRADGFLDPADELLRRYATLRETLAAGSGGTCAKVKIAISQDVMMTRTAFRATLELQNEREDELTEVGFSLRVTDAAGQPADDLFNIQVTRLTGLAAIDGTGQIPANGLGTVQWTLIPRDTAAQEADMRYTVGGVIHYVQNGVEFNIPVENVPITVKPDAALTLKYFHQRDVFSDDPHTDIVEPAIPYKLAVMVENSGFGEARNLRIISGQPQIVENEKGLFIDFKIIGTEVDGQPLSPSLTADFGNVAPGQRKIATWLMTSTLQGLFTDYSATFQHTSGLGDSRISLMKNVEIHEMIRMVRAQGPGEDSAPDFLVNDVLDANDYPDTIHYSDGGTDLVTLRQTGNFTGTLSPSNLTVTLNVGAFTGWSYIRLPDPGNGAYRLVSATRSDGRVLPLDYNVWQTDRTFIGNGRRPTYEHILHMADDDSSGSYTLVYELAVPADSIPPTSTVAALPADSYQDISVTWSGSDNSGIAFYDVYVSVNGGSWTPWRTRTYATGGVYSGTAGNTYAFYSVATDFGGNVEVKTPAAEASTTVSISNLPPVIAEIPDQTINEGEIFTLRASATDPDGNNSDIRFSIGANRPGFTIDPVTGVIQWTTSEKDGGITATVTVVARDGGVPAAVGNETFTITVVDVNDPPVISQVAPQSLGVGSILLVDVDATDGDYPAQTISFSLSAAPDGASIDSQTGVVTWSPVAGQGGRSHLFTVVATDSGTPARSAQMSFAVTVNEEGDSNPLFTSVPVVLWTKGHSYSLLVAAVDPDGDAIALSANLVTAAGSTFADLGGGSGRLSWNLQDVSTGVYEVPVTATANGRSVNATVRIKVVDDNLYWNWIKDAFGELNSTFDLSLLEMDADPDGDGIANVHEMAFLTNPLMQDRPKVEISIERDDPFSIIRLMTKRRAGSQAFVEFSPVMSTDLLGAWQPVPPPDWTAEINPRGDEDGRPETDTVEFLLYEYHPLGAPEKSFYRVQSKRRSGN